MILTDFDAIEGRIERFIAIFGGVLGALALLRWGFRGGQMMGGMTGGGGGFTEPAMVRVVESSARRGSGPGVVVRIVASVRIVPSVRTVASLSNCGGVASTESLFRKRTRSAFIAVAL